MRRHFFDQLTPEQVEQLGEITGAPLLHVVGGQMEDGRGHRERRDAE